MADEGSATVAVNTGSATAADNAGSATAADNAGSRTYTENDVAGMRYRVERDTRNAIQQEFLDRFGVESIDAIDAAMEATRTATEKAELAQKKAARDLAAAIKRAETAEERAAALTQREHDRVAADAIATAAGKVNAHADLVTLKVRSQIRVDDEGKAYVTNGGGEPAEMTVEQLVASVVKDDPRLAAAPQHQGGGSLPAGTSPPKDPDTHTVEGRAKALAPLLAGMGFGGESR